MSREGRSFGSLRKIRRSASEVEVDNNNDYPRDSHDGPSMSGRRIRTIPRRVERTPVANYDDQINNEVGRSWMGEAAAPSTPASPNESMDTGLAEKQVAGTEAVAQEQFTEALRPSVGANEEEDSLKKLIRRGV